MSVRCEANSNRTGDWAPFCRVPKRNRGRLGTLFIAGAIAVIAGLLFPLSARILDVLLIFSLSLTAAVLIIAFSAQGALQVLGFPLLIVLAAMLRMALAVACSQLILSQGNTGTIINLLGAIFVRNNCVLTILVFGTLAAVSFGIICKAANGISRTSAEFTADITPIKQISIDSDLNAGVINKSQALNLREKIARETGFFVAMAGAARFMLCCAVIELVVIIVNIIGGMAIGTVFGELGRAVTSTTAEMSVKTYATLAVGAGMMTQISALLVAAASVYLVRKSSVSPAANVRTSEQEFAERIEVVAKEVTYPRAVESQYGNIEAEKKVITEDGSAELAEVLEWFDEPADDNNEKDDLRLWSIEDTKDSDYYETIAELIESRGGSRTAPTKTILMAAESVEELPVTIPVNIAMRLAKRGQKCLLIDLDLERDAISKVFDVDSAEPGDKLRTKAISMGTPTCINNLWVLPASNFSKGDGDPDATNIKDVIASLESRYDRLVVYAPNVGTPASADRDRFAGCVQAAILFGRDPGPEGESKSSAISDLHKLLISYGCAIFEPTILDTRFPIPDSRTSNKYPISSIELYQTATE